ncbi:MAG: polysaccharide deacetylase family protein, partial [Candidatus Heimdallarchaeota archaeon]
MEREALAENVSVILHWNTDYAEIPRKELPVVVEKSYDPMVKAIEDWRDGTICFNITGHTIEYLLANYPELVERIKALVKDNTVEMLACGYSHPILPLLPRERVKTQLEDHINFIKKIFGKKPVGIWPPELAVSPSVLSQIKNLGIEWAAVDYEHFLLAQHFGNDRNPFERRDETLTEELVQAFWSKGLNKLKSYLKAKRSMDKTNQTQIQPLRRAILSDTETMKVYLSAVSWTYSTQFAVGGAIAIYNDKTHLKSILKTKTKMLPLYASDIEFFGYRDMGPDPAPPKSLIDFLVKLKKHNISTSSPSSIADDEWAQEPEYICSGSWAPDKSFRIWTDSEDNKEYLRRADEIYAHLRARNWSKELMTKIEPYLRIMENSDPRGW